MKDEFEVQLKQILPLHSEKFITQTALLFKQLSGLKCFETAVFSGVTTTTKQQEESGEQHDTISVHYTSLG